MNSEDIENLKEDIKELFNIKPRGRLYFFLSLLMINIIIIATSHISTTIAFAVYLLFVPKIIALIVARCKDLQWRAFIPVASFIMFFFCEVIIMYNGINIYNNNDMHTYSQYIKFIVLMYVLLRFILLVYSFVFFLKKGKNQADE